MQKTIEIKYMELKYYAGYEFMVNEVKDIVEFFDMSAIHVDNDNILLGTYDDMVKINIKHYNNKIESYDLYIDNTKQKQAC